MLKTAYYWPLLLVLSLLTVACTESGSSQQNTQSDATASTATASAKSFNWKIVTTWQPNFPIFQEGVEKFAKDVEAMSGGRLKIQVFAGGELVPPLQTFDVVSEGKVEMGHGAAYYWAGKVPAAQFMSAVPFGMTATGMNAWLYGGEGLKLWRELYAPFNVMSFPAGNTGVQMGGWFNKKIETVDDLKGLKMRIPGLGGKVLAKAGGTPVLLAGGEIYTALERGAIDATEWVGPFHDQRMGLNRAAKYYYYPGWHEPGTTLELIVNLEAWESLPEDLQRIVESAATGINQWIHSQFEGRNFRSLNEFREQSNVEVLPFPPAVLEELKRLTREVMEENSAKDENFKKIYEAYSQFQANHGAWSEVAEIAYQQAMNLQADKASEAEESATEPEPASEESTSDTN